MSRLARNDARMNRAHCCLATRTSLSFDQQSQHVGARATFIARTAAARRDADKVSQACANDRRRATRSLAAAETLDSAAQRAVGVGERQ